MQCYLQLRCSTDGGSRIRRAVLIVLMMVTISMTSACVCQTTSVTISINAAQNRHPINPNIYGPAYARPQQLLDVNIPFHRLGGNNPTRYNWQLNADNKGADWFFESIPYNSAVSSEAADTFIQNS